MSKQYKIELINLVMGLAFSPLDPILLIIFTNFSKFAESMAVNEDQVQKWLMEDEDTNDNLTENEEEDFVQHDVLSNRSYSSESEQEADLDTYRSIDEDDIGTSV